MIPRSISPTVPWSRLLLRPSPLGTAAAARRRRGHCRQHQEPDRSGPGARGLHRRQCFAGAGCAAVGEAQACAAAAAGSKGQPRCQGVASPVSARVALARGTLEAKRAHCPASQQCPSSGLTDRSAASNHCVAKCPRYAALSSGSRRPGREKPGDSSRECETALMAATKDARTHTWARRPRFDGHWSHCDTRYRSIDRASEMGTPDLYALLGVTKRSTDLEVRGSFDFHGAFCNVWSPGLVV